MITQKLNRELQKDQGDGWKRFGRMLKNGGEQSSGAKEKGGGQNRAGD